MDRSDSDQLTGSLSGSSAPDLAVLLKQISRWCEQHNIQFDQYGEGSLINDFEAKIAKLLGFPAARFMPTGVLAQLVALKVWCRERGSNHFGMHPTSHLEIHEEGAYKELYRLKTTLVGPSQSPILAQHLQTIPSDMRVLLTELPIREIGGELPSWMQLNELKSVAKERGMRLHLDGARLWETQPYYQRSYQDICHGFDSVYVSFYKGIGALPGAMLLGSEAFIADAKIWQRRAGGTVQTLGPQVASASMLFDQRIADMPRFCSRAKQLSVLLNSIGEIYCRPEEIQTNMMHVHLPFSARCANAARDAVIDSFGVRLFGRAIERGADACYFELSVGVNTMKISDSEIATMIHYFVDVASDDVQIKD
ncbi:MAG: beta-eliminating lyase-related protein [Porticoccaceae bacterium]|nr:beta-eliminating lyase-related protein [Porticoccaceae bacterium]MDG1474141.1 beta-eliminating lyase-related protein [Porticoccaceae bacterium]